MGWEKKSGFQNLELPGSELVLSLPPTGAAPPADAQIRAGDGW